MLTITQQTHQGSYTYLRISQVENCAFLAYQYMRGMTTNTYLHQYFNKKSLSIYLSIVPVISKTEVTSVIGYQWSVYLGTYNIRTQFRLIHMDILLTWISNPCLLLCQSSFCQYQRTTRTVGIFQLHILAFSEGNLLGERKRIISFQIHSLF